MQFAMIVFWNANLPRCQHAVAKEADIAGSGFLFLQALFSFLSFVFLLFLISLPLLCKFQANFFFVFQFLFLC